MQKYGITDRPVAIRCRDSLSQAIFKEEEEGKEVFLDLRALGEDRWPKDNFSQSQRELFSKSLSSGEKPLRISPMCHFFIGGVSTDRNGKTEYSRVFMLPGKLRAASTAPTDWAEMRWRRSSLWGTGPVRRRGSGPWGRVGGKVSKNWPTPAGSLFKNAGRAGEKVWLLGRSENR